MKSIYLFTLASLIFTAVSFGQTTDPNSVEFHLKKRKANITAGWILVGVGALAVGGGIAMDFDDNFHIFEPDPPPYDYTGITIACVGGGMIISSIPCFISANKHKKSAQTSITIKNIRTPDRNLSYGHPLVVSVTIRF